MAGVHNFDIMSIKFNVDGIYAYIISCSQSYKNNKQ